jgi:hypothetical protein
MGTLEAFSGREAEVSLQKMDTENLRKIYGIVAKLYFLWIFRVRFFVGS